MSVKSLIYRLSDGSAAHTLRKLMSIE